jgi:hypothetical protein
MTFLVKIKNEKARRILEDLASLEIIEISEEPKQSSSDKTKPKTLTYFASEASLSKTWDNPTEDKAWKDL